MSQTEPQAPRPAPRRRWTNAKEALIAAVAGVAVVVALLLTWSPWSGGSEPTDADGSGSSSPTVNDSDTSTSTAPSEDSGATSGGTPGSPPPDDPTGPTNGGDSARVPTVVGMPLAQAISEVEVDFGNVRAVAKPNGAGETCTVIAQDPASGEYSTNTRVTLTYAGTEAECGS